MTVCKKKKKKEAYRRMTELQLNINGIQEFMKEDRLNISSGGSLMHLDDEQTAIVQRFEEEYDVLVYHVIQNDTYLGTLLTLLFVSDQPGEWEQDRAYVKARNPLTYVINLDHETQSEFGSVKVETHAGVMVRTL